MSTVNRLTRLISRQGLVIIFLLVVLGVGSLAGAVWVYTTPTTDTITEQTAVQSISTDAQTSAVVTGNTTLYEPRERLEDMPVYFLEPTPILSITLVTTTPRGIETRLSQRLVIDQQATRDGRVFFETNRTFIDEQTVSTRRTTASTQINMTALREEITANREQVGSVGSFQARMVLTVEYQTDQYAGTLTATSPIVFTSGAYWLDAALADSQQHSTPVTRQVTRPPDAGLYGSLAILGLLFLAGAVGVAYGRTKIDIESVSLAYYHEEYEDWISRGEFPTGTDKRYISINSLEDLVDIAIDSNKRVIFDTSLGVYSVVDGDLVYYFSRDPFNIDVWLDT